MFRWDVRYQTYVLITYNKIKLIRFNENKLPEGWNSMQGFDYKLCVEVIAGEVINSQTHLLVDIIAGESIVNSPYRKSPPRYDMYSGESIPEFPYRKYKYFMYMKLISYMS